MVCASATRCHLSTAIFASGSAARIPDAYGADGSITTISIAVRNSSDLLAQPLLHAASGAARSQPQQRSRPVAGAVDEAGQPRIGPLPGDAVQDPADRSGTGSHRSPARSSAPVRQPRAAAAISALCAVGHDTPYSAATSETARLRRRDRGRHLVPQPFGDPARGRTAVEVWVNDRRGHSASPARPSDASATTARPAAPRRAGPSTGSVAVPSPPLTHPTRRTRPSRAVSSMITLIASGAVRCDLQHAELVLETEQHCALLGQHFRRHFEWAGDVASDMLVASLLVRCERPTACRGHDHPVRKRITGARSSVH